jgi:hypothetical protein
VGPKTSDPVVMDSERSFLIFFEFLGRTVFSTEDPDNVRAGCVPMLRGDVRLGGLIVFCLLVGEGSSITSSVRLLLVDRGVGAGVGDET